MIKKKADFKYYHGNYYELAPLLCACTAIGLLFVSLPEIVCKGWYSFEHYGRIIVGVIIFFFIFAVSIYCFLCYWENERHYITTNSTVFKYLDNISLKTTFSLSDYSTVCIPMEEGIEFVIHQEDINVNGNVEVNFQGKRGWINVCTMNDITIYKNM